MVKVMLVYVSVVCSPQLDVCTGCTFVFAQVSIPSIPFSLGITVSPSQFFMCNSLAPVFTLCNSVSQTMINGTDPSWA